MGALGMKGEHSFQLAFHRRFSGVHVAPQTGEEADRPARGTWLPWEVHFAARASLVAHDRDTEARVLRLRSDIPRRIHARAIRPLVMARTLPLILVQAMSKAEQTSGMTTQEGMGVEDRPSEKGLVARGFRTRPQAGDVLASRPTARADLYAISIFPVAAHVTATRYSEAIETVRKLARGRRVDGWFTCNHTHYARVSAHRL
jgi:hypothetical protein